MRTQRSERVSARTSYHEKGWSYGLHDSGLDREGLRYAVEEMTERKLLVVNLT
jgi:hypothetical protein